MARFCQINDDNLVIRCIEVTQEYINTGKLGDPAKWILSAEFDGDFRYNMAGEGYTFMPEVGNDGAFVCPQPFSNWVLDTTTYQWKAPVDKPREGRWEDPVGIVNYWLWNEESGEWFLYKYDAETGDEVI